MSTMEEESADKVDVRNVVAASVAPENRDLPFQMNNQGSQYFNSTGEDRILSPGLSGTQAPLFTTGVPPVHEGPTIEINMARSTPVSKSENSMVGKKSSGKLSRQYILPDGSVAANGKGLGRGRPGIKRGPRKPKSEDSVSISLTPMSGQSTPTQQPAPIALKRKRTDSVTSSGPMGPVASDPLSRESTPEYNPTASQTRSGRQTQKPVSIVAPSLASESPAPKRPSLTSTPSTPALRTHPKIKRRVYKGKEQHALCEHCLRGFGPPGNVIVFCDACNKCWHQRCHKPLITKEIVADTTAEWFCATCDKILHGSKKSKKPPAPAIIESSTPSAPQPVMKYGAPIVGAAALTLPQRKAYLNTLNKQQLIDLVLIAGEYAPDTPLFETLPAPPPPPRKQPLPQFASNYITPVDHFVDYDRPGTNDVLDEGYDDHFDEHAALYPKPGEGIQLPPDRVDLRMLLESVESKTFSHWVRGMPMKTTVDTGVHSRTN